MMLLVNAVSDGEWAALANMTNVTLYIQNSRTVEPSRVVLGSAQLLSTTHRPVHRSVTTGEVSHRGAIVVAVCRHHVAGVLTRSVRTLGRTSDPALHVA